VLNRAQKQEQVEAIREKFNRATSVYLVDYRGIDVPAAQSLRSRIRKEGGGDYEYQVSKNSLLKRACEDTSASEIAEHFQGPTAIAFSYGDPVGLAKILDEFASANDPFELKAGLLDGKPVTPAEIGQLAKLPPLDALRGKIVGLLQAPATKIARLVGEPGAGLARLIAARRDKLESEGAS